MTDLFQAYGQTIVITAAGTSQASTLPLPGGEGNRDIRIYNSHSAVVYVKTGDSTVVAKVASSGSAGLPVINATTIFISAPTKDTHIAAKAASGSGDVYFTTGVVIK